VSTERIFGRRAVLEALRAGAERVEKVLLARGGKGAILEEVRSAAEARHVALEWVERKRLDQLAGAEVHQGVMAVLKSRRYSELEDLLARAKDGASGLLVVTDEIEDPRNLGAIARCAEGAGAQGLIITARRSAEVTAAAEKAAGGALQHLSVTRVGNLVQAFEQMKAAGFWLVGLDAAAGQDLWDADLRRPLAVVVGNEGKGLRRLTREKCDYVVKIPMAGKVASLNASVAVGIVLYEVRRQRRTP
jgi:23S rRNA (guanosine2251-2'-O)-methyltransferase